MNLPLRFRARDGTKWIVYWRPNLAARSRADGSPPVTEPAFLEFRGRGMQRVLMDPPDDWPQRLPELLERAALVDD
jgi:hypothetical protein